jgi:hypothetical protein
MPIYTPMISAVRLTNGDSFGAPNRSVSAGSVDLW